MKIVKIIDKRGTGKTLRLILLAKENNGIVVCQNPAAMKDKVVNGYGITGVEFLSYMQYLEFLRTRHAPDDRPIYIDELSTFLTIFDRRIAGYTESAGDFE